MLLVLEIESVRPFVNGAEARRHNRWRPCRANAPQDQDGRRRAAKTMRSSEHESLLVGAWRLTATVDRAEEVHMLWIGPNDEVTSDDGAALSATPLRSGKWKAKRDADGLAMDLLFGIGSGHTPLSLIGRGAIDNGTVVRILNGHCVVEK